MAKVDLGNMSLKELEGLQKDVNAAIAGYEKKRRDEALKEMEAVAKKHGLSMTEVVSGTAKKSAKAKSPPKYRNPDDKNQTWSGRGRQPQWFKSALDTGKSPDDLAI